MTSDAAFEIQLLPRAGQLTELMDRIEAYAEAAGLPARLAARLMLVSEEWAANVVHHGAPGATSLRLSVRRCGLGLRLVAEDDGPAFDPAAAAVPDVAAPLDRRRVGGLGLHLLRRLSRELVYERTGPVNRLSLVLDAEADPPGSATREG